MNPETILQIIRLSLELSIKLIDNMTDEQRKAFAERHEKRMEFWQNLFEKVRPSD